MSHQHARELRVPRLSAQSTSFTPRSSAPSRSTTTHCIWTIASNRYSPDRANIDAIHDQSVFTFNEGKVVIEAQYANLARFPEHRVVDIHVDLAADRVRRIVDRLAKDSSHAPAR